MKLADARENYYYFSGKVSEIARQLAFAGIGIVWVFRTTVPSGSVLPRELYAAVVWLVLTLGADFAHYLAATILWGTYHRYREKRVAPDEEFVAPRAINWPALAFFYLKVVLLVIAYVWIGAYLKNANRNGLTAQAVVRFSNLQSNSRHNSPPFIASPDGSRTGCLAGRGRLSSRG